MILGVMRPLTGRTSLALGAALAAVVLLPAMASASAGSPAPHLGATAPTIDYVAVGDSYAAGNGASSPLTGPVDAACLRTSNGYPSLLAESARAATGVSVDLDLAACSGATTLSTLVGADPAPGVDGVPRDIVGPDQLAGVSSDTDVVTVTVGANDTDFGSVLRACLATPAGCEAAAQAGAALYDPQELVDLLLAVDAAVAGAPGPVPVVVTGYPQLFDTVGLGQGQCAASTLAPASAELAEAINLGTRALNGQLAATTAQVAANAANTRIQFVDVDPAFEGHRICSPQPWITPPALNMPSDRWIHPDDAGHAAYAAAILAAVDLSPGVTPPTPPVSEPPVTTTTGATATSSATDTATVTATSSSATDDPSSTATTSAGTASAVATSSGSATTAVAGGSSGLASTGATVLPVVLVAVLLLGGGAVAVVLAARRRAGSDGPTHAA